MRASSPYVAAGLLILSVAVALTFLIASNDSQDPSPPLGPSDSPPTVKSIASTSTATPSSPRPVGLHRQSSDRPAGAETSRLPGETQPVAPMPEEVGPTPPATLQPVMTETEPAMALGSEDLVGVRLHGSVHDDSWRPVVAELKLRGLGDSYLDLITDAEGRFDVELDKAGSWSLSVEAAGYRSHVEQIEVPDTGTAVSIELSHGAKIDGWVEDDGGLALHELSPGDLRVLVSSTEHSGVSFGAEVSPQGEFEIDRLPAGHYAVGLVLRGFVEEPQHHLILEAGDSRRMRLVTPAVGDVDLLAHFPDGAPPTLAARFVLWPVEGRQEISQSVRLSSGHEVGVRSLIAGTYHATLEVDGLAPLPPQSLEIVPGGSGSLVFRWPRAVLKGQVEGRSAAHSEVTVWQLVAGRGDHERRDTTPLRRIKTDNTGYFELHGLMPGRFLAVAEGPDGNASAEVSVAEDESAWVVLSPDAGQDLEVRVSHLGDTLGDVGVVAVRRPYADVTRAGRTDASGRAHLGSLPPGTYSVRASWLAGEDGPMKHARATLELVTGASPRPVELHLQ